MSELRIGTTERELALDALGSHFAEGRLSKEEYDERSDAAWSARTAADVRSLFRDLPGGSPLESTQPPRREPVPGAPGFHSMRRGVWHALPVPFQVMLVIFGLLALGAVGPSVLVVVVVCVALAGRHRSRRPPPPWRGGR